MYSFCLCSFCTIVIPYTRFSFNIWKDYSWIQKNWISLTSLLHLSVDVHSSHNQHESYLLSFLSATPPIVLSHNTKTRYNVLIQKDMLSFIQKNSKWCVKGYCKTKQKELLSFGYIILVPRQRLGWTKVTLNKGFPVLPPCGKIQFWRSESNSVLHSKCYVY